jgi:hypothetical protein
MTLSSRDDDAEFLLSSTQPEVPTSALHACVPDKPCPAGSLDSAEHHGRQRYQEELPGVILAVACA